MSRLKLPSVACAAVLLALLSAPVSAAEPGAASTPPQRATLFTPAPKGTVPALSIEAAEDLEFTVRGLAPGQRIAKKTAIYFKLPKPAEGEKLFASVLVGDQIHLLTNRPEGIWIMNPALLLKDQAEREVTFKIRLSNLKSAVAEWSQKVTLVRPAE